jgi:site-specific DNA recombinase
MIKDINENDMSKAAFEYERKSEEDKKRQILSLEDQQKENKETLKKHDLELVHPPFQEEKPAKKPDNRPEFNRMVKLLTEGKAKNIVCWAANRLARNIPDGAKLLDLVQNHGVKIYTPYTVYDSSNWFMLLIEFGMSTDFSLKLSKDVKRGLESKVAKGYRPGLPPIGYLNFGDIKGEKTIVSDPKRFDLVKRWWEMMFTGKYTVEQSLEAITELGLRDRRGDPVSRTAAFKIFQNIYYAGYFSWLGEIHKGAHEPMISLEQFNKVHKIISGKFGGKYEAPRIIRPMPLAGFIKCGECGATITADRKTKHYKDGTSQDYAWYRCKKNKSTCTQKAYLPADELEAQVRSYITNLELDPRFIDWVRKVLKRRNREEFVFDYKQKELLSKRLLELNEKKERIFAMKIDGLYSDDQYKKKKADVLKEEADIREQLDSDRITYWERVIDETLDFSTRIMHFFNRGDDYTKRMVLQTLGSDLRLKDKKLYLEAKSVFVFLRNKQNELLTENNLVGLKKKPLQKSNQDFSTPQVHLGAGEGTRTPDVLLGKQTFYH